MENEDNMEKNKILNKGLVYIFSFVFFSVLFLVLDEPKESIFLILSISMLIIIIKDREKILSGIPIYLIIVFFLLSYVISILLIFTKGYPMELSIDGTTKDIEGKAVLLVYEGESEMYSFKKSVTNIRKNGTLKSKVFIPFALWTYKGYYHKFGKSDYKENTIKVKKQLQTLLAEDYKVYVSYLYDTDYAEEVLIHIVNDGYRDVIIVPAFLTDGESLSILKSRIEGMKLFNLNINVKYIDPLWNSEVTVDSYGNKIKQFIDEDSIANTGIILVGECQKGYKNNKSLKAVKEDSMFRNRIKLKLINTYNINEHKIKVSWFNYIDPDYGDSLKSLLDYNVGRIIIIYTKPSVTSMENTIISKKISSKIDIPEGVTVTIIDGFLNDPYFIKEIKNRVEFTNLQKWE